MREEGVIAVTGVGEVVTGGRCREGRAVAITVAGGKVT